MAEQASGSTHTKTGKVGGGARATGATGSKVNVKTDARCHDYRSDKYDYARTEYARKEDPRLAGPPCLGKHLEAPMGRGSLSGCNAHGIWVTCARCSLRLRYTPAFGSHGMYRKAGPTPVDVTDTIKQLEKDKSLDDSDVTSASLRTEVIALEAVELSLERKLEEIKSQRARLKEKTPPPPPPAKASQSKASSQGAPTAARPKKRYVPPARSASMSESSDQEAQMPDARRFPPDGQAWLPEVREEDLTSLYEDRSWTEPRGPAGGAAASSSR
jgi:hypothetical protein